jgi:hypothetical protein
VPTFQCQPFSALRFGKSPLIRYVSGLWRRGDWVDHAHPPARASCTARPIGFAGSPERRDARDRQRARALDRTRLLCSKGPAIPSLRPSYLTRFGWSPLGRAAVIRSARRRCGFRGYMRGIFVVNDTLHVDSFHAARDPRPED